MTGIERVQKVLEECARVPQGVISDEDDPILMIPRGAVSEYEIALAIREVGAEIVKALRENRIGT